MSEVGAAEAPKLAPPGAGVPFATRLFLRHVVGPFVAARSDWQVDSARFNAYSASAQELVRQLDDSALQKKVLVPRQTGLEDSSRFWSAGMTLEHMTLVGRGISSIIISLSQGQVPDRVVDTAAVKPAGLADPHPLREDFRLFCHEAIAHIDAHVADRNSRARLAHPWFGPFTARQWHWLLATHQGLHLRQIRDIMRRL